MCKIVYDSFIHMAEKYCDETLLNDALGTEDEPKPPILKIDINGGSCDQFVKLALAARPAGPATPASSSSSTSPLPSPGVEVLIGSGGSPTSGNLSSSIGSIASATSSSSSQKHLETNLSTAISTYSNASTACPSTGNYPISSSSHPSVVFLPVEKGFVARKDDDEWFCPEKSRLREERALAVERDRLVRSRSVAKDLLMNLPVSIQRPDGEELYWGTSARLKYSSSNDHRRPDSDVTKTFHRGPPNKTVWDSPDFQDWNPKAAKSCTCSPAQNQARPKNSSTGHLSSLTFYLSRSGKSPSSSHNRTRHNHPRHSQAPNPKNSCTSSSTASISSSKHKNNLSSANSPSLSKCSSASTSSTTLSCVGLLGATNSSHNNTSSGVFSAIGGKIQSAFLEKSHSVGCASTGSDNLWTNPNNNSSSSSITSVSPKSSVETKISCKPLPKDQGSQQAMKNAKYVHSADKCAETEQSIESATHTSNSKSKPVDVGINSHNKSLSPVIISSGNTLSTTGDTTKGPETSAGFSSSAQSAQLEITSTANSTGKPSDNSSTYTCNSNNAASASVTTGSLTTPTCRGSSVSCSEHNSQVIVKSV